MNKKKTNLEYMESLYYIQDKRGYRVKFKANDAQRYYESKRTRRNLILKARKKGMTTYIDGDQAMDCIRKTTNAVVLSHEGESTKRLFRRAKYMVQSLDPAPKLRIDSSSEMSFPYRNSYFYVGTAGQKAFGRGDDIHRAHLSEAAFYPDLEKLMAGLAEAAEYGQIDLETTPNGNDHFKTVWDLAKLGKSVYTPIFIPWFIDNQNSIFDMTKEEIEGLSKTVQDMFAIPEGEFELDEDEKELVKRVKMEYGRDLGLDQIKWRRYKIWDKGDFFFQEYPEDDVSCFLRTGRPVFPKVTVRQSYRQKLQKGVQYFGAIDGAEGIEGGDRHAFSILDLRDIQPTDGAEEGRVRPHVAFEYVSDEPIDVFWQKILPKLREFNINLGIEKNGVGVAHVNKARQLGVRLIEWTTTGVNRPVMLAELSEAYRKEVFFETYPEAADEAQGMFYNEQNRATHPKSKHDDRVFSRAIAFQISRLPIPKLTMM